MQERKGLGKHTGRHKLCKTTYFPGKHKHLTKGTLLERKKRSLKDETKVQSPNETGVASDICILCVSSTTWVCWRLSGCIFSTSEIKAAYTAELPRTPESMH